MINLSPDVYHRSQAVYFFLPSLEEDLDDFGVCLLDAEEVDEDADEEDGACLPLMPPTPPPKPPKSFWNSERDNQFDFCIIQKLHSSF